MDETLQAQAAAPGAGLEASNSPLAYAAQPAEQYALYSSRAVALATILGSPAAGMALVALNYRRLGRPKAAVQAMVWGLVGTAGLVGLGFLIPARAMGMTLAALVALLVMKIAELLQADDFGRHKAAGGKAGSLWKAAGVGVLGAILIFGSSLAVVMAVTPAPPSRLAVGNGDILYSGSASSSDAAALGKALTDAGYFGGNKKATVTLSRNASGATIQFVVNEQAGQKQSVLDIYSQIIEQIAPSVGGKPIMLKLVNSDLKELQSKKVE